jgi:hypothetical protein
LKQKKTDRLLQRYDGSECLEQSRMLQRGNISDDFSLYDKKESKKQDMIDIV